MSLAPDIFTMPIVGTFLALAAVVIFLLVIMKIIDLVSRLKLKKLDLVELTFTLVKFAILVAPVAIILYTAFQGIVPNAAETIIYMFSGLFLWGTVKIIYDLITEVF